MRRGYNLFIRRDTVLSTPSTSPTVDSVLNVAFGKGFNPGNKLRVRERWQVAA